MNSSIYVAGLTDSLVRLTEDTIKLIRNHTKKGSKSICLTGAPLYWTVILAGKRFDVLTADING